MVTMRSTSGRAVGGVSFAGQTYEPDGEGIFEVPDEAVAELRHHGLESAVRAGRPLPRVVGTARVKGTIKPDHADE